MRTARALADALIRVAARRWPDDTRDELAAAWAAELEALRRDPSLGPARRAYRQIRFALSLAISKPVEPAGGAAGFRWRESTLGAPGQMARLVALLVLPYAGAKLVAAAHLASGSAVRLLTRGPAPAIAQPGLVIVNALGAVIGLTAIVLIGHRLARRWPTRSPAGPTSILVLTVGVAAGAYLTDALGPNRDGVWLRLDVAIVAMGTVAWLVLVTALLAVVRRLDRGVVGLSGAPSPWLAVVALAVAGGLGVAEFAAAVAALPYLVVSGANPLLGLFGLPLALTADRNSGALPSPTAEFLIGNSTLAALPLVLLAATAVALPLGLVRPAPARRADQPAAPAAPIRLRGLGLVVASAGLAMWIATVAIVTPAQRVRVDTVWSEEQSQYLAWAHDVGQAAALLGVLGLMVGGRALAVPAAALASLALLATGIALDNGRMAGAGAITVAVTLAVLAIGGVLGWSAVAARRPRDPVHRRRLLAGAAVLAAYCAPTLLFRGGWTPPAYDPVPAGLAEGTAVVIGGLVAVAVAFADAARETPLSRFRARGLVGGAGLAAGLAAYALTFVGVWAIAPVLGPALAVGVLALARARPRATSRLRFVATWTLAAAAGAVAAIPLLIACFLLPSIVASGVDLGGDHSGDAYSVLPGALVVGAVLAIAAGPLAVRREPTTAVRPADQPRPLAVPGR